MSPDPIACERFPILLEDGTILRLPVRTAVWQNDSWISPGLVRGREKSNVKRAIIAIHGNSEDVRAQTYLERTKQVTRLADKQAETLIICPDLVREEWIKPEPSSRLDILLEPNLIFWQGGMFTGGLSAIRYQEEGFPDRPGRVSILEILNQILNYLVRSGDYPHLQSIVIAGQSGGGATVARYAALGLYDPVELPQYESSTTRTIVQPLSGSCIEVRYVPMSAGFLYFSDERFIPDTSRDSPKIEFFSESEFERVFFERPNNAALRWALALAKMEVNKTTVESLRSRYNNYEFGLADFNENLDHYMRSIGLVAARKNMKKRHITYLAGGRDFLPAYNMPSAYLQGINAAQRALIYKRHLQKVQLWDENLHSVKIVAGAGHSGLQLMSSIEGLRALFPPLPYCSPSIYDRGEIVAEIVRLIEMLAQPPVPAEGNIPR